MRRDVLRALAALAIISLAGRGASAQERVEARLLVTVKDASGRADTGTVTVTRSVDGGSVWQRDMGTGRAAWFVGLDSGDYIVTTSFPSNMRLETSIRVAAREVIVLSLARSSDGLALDRVDRLRDGEGADFDVNALASLPVSDVWALAETAPPFVVAERFDTGGIGTGTAALVSSRGESWATAVVVVDGMETGAPGPTGRLPSVPSVASIGSLAVASGLAPVEARSPGVRLLAESFRSRERWGGHFDGGITTNAMVGENDLPRASSAQRIDDWRGASFAFGGPARRDWDVAFSGSTAKATFDERRLTLHSAGAHTVTGSVAGSGPRGRVRLAVAAERVFAPYDGRRQFADTNVREDGTFVRARALFDRSTPAGFRGWFAVGGHGAVLRPNVTASRAGGVVDRVTMGVVPRPPADVERTGWNVQVGADAPAYALGGMVHTVRAGATAEELSIATTYLAFPVVAETVAGLPARVWRPEAPTAASSRSLRQLSAFVADRVFVGRGLTFDVGLRVDRVTGAAVGAANGLAWNLLSPRASFRWSEARVAVFGGVGRYLAADATPALAFGDPGEPRGLVRRWSDLDGDGRVDEGEDGQTIARAGRHASIASIDAALRPPTSTEWTIGVEYRPTAGSSLRGAAIIRKQRDLVGSINVGVPAGAYRTFTVPDIGSDEGGPQDDQVLTIYDRRPESFGQDAFLLTNPAQARVDYEGLEFTYSLAGRRWFMLVGATAYRAVGWGGDRGAGPLENDPSVLGERYEVPNAYARPANRLFGDRAYVGKWSGGFRNANHFSVAGIVRYQDGQPFTRVVVAELSTGPEMIEAYALGRTRYTYAGTIDVRIEKGFSLGRSRLAVRADVFNLTNHKNEVEEDVVGGPAFRRSTAVQPPITMRLGFRVDF
jgi:hypothetical protein